MACILHAANGIGTYYLYFTKSPSAYGIPISRGECTKTGRSQWRPPAASAPASAKHKRAACSRRIQIRLPPHGRSPRRLCQASPWNSSTGWSLLRCRSWLSGGYTLPNIMFAAGMPQFLFRRKNTILSVIYQAKKHQKKLFGGEMHFYIFAAEWKKMYFCKLSL